MSSAYEPIDCAFHDELQLRAISGAECHIVYRDEAGIEHHISGVIMDVFARDGAEYLCLRNGQEIRLDRLIRLNQ